MRLRKLDRKISTTCWCHVMTPSQVSWFSCMFRIYRNWKTKFLNVSSQAMTPRCLNFIPISGMGPWNLPEDTHVIFQPALVHWSMCLYLKFELCTQRWHVPSQNHEPSWEKLRFARNLYQNLFLFCIFLPQHGSTMTWHHAKFHDFQACFWYKGI